MSGPAPPRHVHGVLTTCRQGQQVPNASVVVRMRARMLLCARALCPLAHPAAHSRAQGTRREVVGELLADRHALAVSQGAPRGGGSPSRPDFPMCGEAREGNAMPSRPRSLQKGGNEDLPRRLRRMAASKPDLHASESPEGRSLRMQGCGEAWQPRNEDIATRSAQCTHP